ncbi:MAG: ATP-binding protein [Acidobacteriaceae bacterium]
MTRRSRISTAMAIAAALALAVLAVVLVRHFEGPSLPYHDSFASRSAKEWQPYGGTWQLTNGTLFNRSDERGAKLVTGSPKWTNYTMQADLEILGHEGDVGVIVRAGKEQRGIDSYNGYYVGLRSLESALIIGRADYGWMEAQPIAMPGGVEPSTWYHLKVVAVDCHIAASATNLKTGQTASAAFEENPCVTKGKVGLRSMATGGAWRNISVQRATLSDWEAIRAHASSVGHPVFPDSEAQYNRMRAQDFPLSYGSPRVYQQSNFLLSPEAPGTPPALVPIESLRNMNLPAPPVRIRGVVTLTHPLYVQDTSAGIAVQVKKPLPLNLGDEIEITGTLANSGYTSRIEASSIRLLWDRTLAVPLSISSTQAASGAFNSSLVEIRGYLRSKHLDPDGTIVLKMGDESQSFTTILRNSLSRAAYDAWQPGSWLRVHGICVLGAGLVSNGAAFTLLTRSPTDIEVLAGPPWWTGPRILWVLIPLALTVLFGLFLYLRIERWKMRAILNERERLAHEMHDTLAQSFAGIGFHLQGMRNMVRGGALSKPADLKEKLDLACDIVAQTHREASAGIAALHPEADGGRDLLVALEHYAVRMLNADTLPLVLNREGTPRELSFPVRDTLFQVGREAISNVIRHGRASTIVLCLRYESKTVTFEVRDDGIGFIEQESGGFGIETMRRRCETVSAELEIISAPGKGTVISVRSPYGRRVTVTDWVRHILKRHSEAPRELARVDE